MKKVLLSAVFALATLPSLAMDETTKGVKGMSLGASSTGRTTLTECVELSPSASHFMRDEKNLKAAAKQISDNPRDVHYTNVAYGFLGVKGSGVAVTTATAKALATWDTLMRKQGFGLLVIGGGFSPSQVAAMKEHITAAIEKHHRHTKDVAGTVNRFVGTPETYTQVMLVPMWLSFTLNPLVNCGCKWGDIETFNPRMLDADVSADGRKIEGMAKEAGFVKVNPFTYRYTG